MFMPLTLSILLAITLATPSCAADKAPTQTTDYESRTASRDGTGKFYMGREISQVMGHLGAGWLERPAREREERTDLFIQRLPLQADHVVADIGAGTGYFTLPVAARVPQGKVYAVDIQPQMLSLLQSRLEATAIENVVPLPGSVDDPGLPTGEVDLAFIVDAYHEFSRDQVRSSIARRLGMDIGGLVPSDRDVEGIVEVMLDATGNYEQPLTEDRLLDWHAALFPTGRSGMRKIIVGQWRDDSDGPMQVVSGPIGRERVHYTAPPADSLPREIARFLTWFGNPGSINPLLAAGLAHLWFVTLHPFDDGNGRIARAIADMALARADNTSQRFYGISAQIRLERNDYYNVLEQAQKGSLDVTAWQRWFLACLERAIDGAQETLASVTAKARFWERFAKEPLNPRQIRVLNRVMDGFEGKLTSTIWARLAKCSQDTAYRDILDLIDRGALQKDPGGGRSTSYSI